VKPILVKVGIGALSLVLAELVWNVLILTPEYWGGSYLQQLTFWLSPLSLTGWLVFLILWTLAYLGLSKLERMSASGVKRYRVQSRNDRV